MYALLEGAPGLDGLLLTLRRGGSLLDDLDESLKVRVCVCAREGARGRESERERVREGERESGARRRQS